MRRIGLDFDNTIVCYDGVFLSAAKQRGLLGSEFSGAKQQVRDAIRLLPDGEIAWRRLQGLVYGRAIGGAQAFTGLAAFLQRARARGDAIFIISHKTQYGHFDPQKIDLREAALGWMKGEGFFDAAGLAIPIENVFFESTRAEKLRRIASTGCDIFVDDLEEVLIDPDFPAGVERILFSPQSAAASRSYKVCAGWAAVEKALFP
jgi:hypothetical protein